MSYVKNTKNCHKKNQARSQRVNCVPEIGYFFDEGMDVLQRIEPNGFVPFERIGHANINNPHIVRLNATDYQLSPGTYSVDWVVVSVPVSEEAETISYQIYDKTNKTPFPGTDFGEHVETDSSILTSVHSSVVINVACQKSVISIRNTTSVPVTVAATVNINARLAIKKLS